MPTSPKAAETPTPTTVKVIVHPRRSAVYQVQVGTRMEDGHEVPIMANRVAAGGETIEVSVFDAEYMEAHGFTTTADALAAFRGAAELASDPKGDQIVRRDLGQQGGGIGLQQQQKSW